MKYSLNFSTFATTVFALLACTQTSESRKAASQVRDDSVATGRPSAAAIRSVEKHSDFAFLFYGGGAQILHPRRVVESDNNWDILLNCRSPQTRDQLKVNGIQFNESQIMLLEAMRLLEDNDGHLKTIMPILLRDQTDKITRELKAVATKIWPHIRPDVEGLRTALLDVGHESSVYQILFAHVLDDLVWRRFREQQLISEMELSEDKPLWSVGYFASTPPPAFRCGMNEYAYSSKGISFKLLWADDALPKRNCLANSV